MGTKIAIKNIQLFWNNLLASLLLRQHNLMHYGNFILSRHNFKLGNQLYTVWICLICLKWPVISVLVILKIPRVYNYNHSNTNRMTVLIWWILVWCAMWHTWFSVFGELRVKTWLGLIFSSLAWLDLVKYQICTSLVGGCDSFIIRDLHNGRTFANRPDKEKIVQKIVSVWYFTYNTLTVARNDLLNFPSKLQLV